MMAEMLHCISCLGARVEAGEEELISVPKSEEEEALFAQIKSRISKNPGWFANAA